MTNSKFELIEASSPHRQSGAVLVLSLVILLIMTLIGTSNMQSSSLQQKMVTNSKLRTETFQVAESALIFAQAKFFSNYSAATFVSTVDGCPVGDATCFDPTCAGGFCYDGEDAGDKQNCKVAKSGVQVFPPFLDESLWEDGSGRFQTAPVVDGTYAGLFKSDPKYIIEFKCYVNRGPGSECATDATGASCRPLFQITTLVEREGEGARVMLSSTFRITTN